MTALRTLSARLRTALAAEDWSGLEALDAEVRSAVEGLAKGGAPADEVDELVACYREVVACLAARRDQVAAELGGLRMQSRLRNRYGG